MKYDKFEKRYSSWKGKGVYLALGCCVLSVVLAGFGIFGSRQKQKNDVTEPSAVITQSSDRAVNNPATNVPDTRRQTEAPTAATTSKPEFILPCGTQIIKDFSRGELVQSKTMGDYRVHSGIDFKAGKGDDVKAVADGKVTNVSENSLWGWVVEIDHGNGMTARYCGLMKTPAVKKGDTVQAGKIIGRAGVVPCESAEETHLHFETRVQGKPSDPLAVLGRAE